MKRFTVSAAFVCLFAAAGGAASAAPIEGTFNLGSLVDVTVGSNYIDWGSNAGGFNVIVNSSSIAGLPAGSFGTLADLTTPPALVGVPISIPNFLTAAAQPNWNFTLNYIAPGSGTDAGCTDLDAATNCTPNTPGGPSPFTIVETEGDVAVSLRMQGTVTDLVGPVSNWNAIFTTQFLDETAISLLSQLRDPGFIKSSHSSTWNSNAEATPVPEPASMMLLGTGLTLLAGVARRKKGNNA